MNRFSLLMLRLLGGLGLLAAAIEFSASACAQAPATDPNQESASPSLDSVPDWIRKGSHEESGVRYILVKTGGFFLESEASIVLSDRVFEAVEREIDRTIEPGACDLVDLDQRYIQSHLLMEEIILRGKIVDPLTESNARKRFGYAYLRFTDKFYSDIRDQFKQNFQLQRLRWAAVIGGVAMAWLAIAWGYLKLDLFTRHFYTRRLQTLALIAAAVSLVIAMVTAFGWGLFN